MNRLIALLKSTIMKYGMSAGISFLVDYCLFALLIRLDLSIMVSTYIARACSCVVNFLLNRNAVFRSEGNPVRQAVGYLLLVIAAATVSGLAVTALAARTGIDPVILKFCVEVVLFFANFLIQKHFIFKH